MVYKHYLPECYQDIEMRVLFVTHYNALLGANRSMLQLMLELRDKGIEPLVLLPIIKEEDSNNSLKIELNKYGLQHIEAPIRVIKHPTLWKVLPNYIYSILLRRKVYEKLNDFEFDIVHSNSSVIDIGKYIAQKKHAPHIWHLREFGDLDYNMYTPFGKWYQRFIYKGPNEFIAISHKIIEHYKKYIPSNHIHLIYNGIKEFGDSVSQRKMSPVNFCMTGLLHPNKCQFDAIKAVKELVNTRHIKEFHLSIIGGGDKNYLADMKEYIVRHSLTPYITFLGQRNDVPELLSKMDVGITASANEAFGRVTVEYMMAGLAVIVSDGGANVEIIENSVEGLIYPTGNHIALADNMAELINNTSKIIELAKNGHRKAIAEFSSKANSEKIAHLYNSICNFQKK